MLRELTEYIKGRRKTEDEAIGYRQVSDSLLSFMMMGNHDDKYRIDIHGVSGPTKFSCKGLRARKVSQLISEFFILDNNHYFEARFQNYKDKSGNTEKWYIDLLYGDILERIWGDNQTMLIKSKPTKKMTIDFHAK